MTGVQTCALPIFLGGSAVYFSLAASLFAQVHLVGVVGSDFPDGYKIGRASCRERV